MKYKATRNVLIDGTHCDQGAEVSVKDDATAELLLRAGDIVPVEVREKAVAKVAKKETANRK